MEESKLLVETPFVSLNFNLIENNGMKLEEFWTPVYWIENLQVVLAMIIAALLVQIRLKKLCIYWQKKYPDVQVLRDGRLQTRSLPKGEIVWSILSTAVALVLVYLSFIYFVATKDRDDTYLVFSSYLVSYLPYVTIGCLAYVSFVIMRGRLCWLTPTNALMLFGDQLLQTLPPVEKVVVPPNVLDEKIVLASLYDTLSNHAKFDPNKVSNDAVRMFDVPFYFSKAGKKEIVRVDGARFDADRYMEELERLGLDKWYFRISKTCRVNMMLIHHPLLPNASHLDFRKEVFDSLRPSMSEMEISNLLLVSEWMRKRKTLKKFLDNAHNLQHKGWDHLIPLHGCIPQ